MILLTNHTKEYRQLRQSAVRRQKNFNVKSEIDSFPPDNEEFRAEAIPWLDDYGCALIALRGLNEACKHQQENYEQFVGSRGLGLPSSLDNDAVDTANTANKLISETEKLISRIYHEGLNVEPSEERMRLNAAKIITLQLKRAVSTYHSVHNKLMAARNMLDVAEENESGGWGRSPPPEARLRTQLMPQQERLFSSHQIKEMQELMEAVTRLFGQTSYLIVEQGSLLDRIDQNVDLAVQKSLQTKQQMRQAEFQQRHGFAKQTIVLLIVMNLIMVRQAALIYLVSAAQLFLNALKIYWRL